MRDRYKDPSYHGATSCGNKGSRAFKCDSNYFDKTGERCSSVVRVFAHGAMGRRINPSLSYTFIKHANFFNVLIRLCWKLTSY